MNEFFDKLGAAAKRAASTVATEVNVAAEEQKLRELYQSLGKLCYQNAKRGTNLLTGEFEEWVAKIDEGVKRVRDLRDRKNVTQDSVLDEDFVDIEE